MKGLFFLIGSFLLMSCAVLPAILPPADSAGKIFACPSPFLVEKTRLIHAIEVRAAGKTQTVMIGVTMIDPATRTISSALMSAEGMSLFEASSGPAGLQISRALPPLNAEDFAQNMISDIDLIFLAPRETIAQKGVLTSGEGVCRRHREEGGWIDVMSDSNSRIHIRRYTEGGSLERNVILAGNADSAYASIELQTTQYTLIMTLIESESVKDELSIRE